MSSRGGGKFVPCARFTPPSWSTTRVISRITDSVNPCTLLDIRSELMGCSCAARPRRCHRRDVTAPDEHAPAWSRPGLVCPSETRVSGHRLGYAYRTGCGVASVGVVNEGHTRPRPHTTRSRACQGTIDRKSTRLNSSHRCISYAVFCLKKKKHNNDKQ